MVNVRTNGSFVDILDCLFCSRWTTTQLDVPPTDGTAATSLNVANTAAKSRASVSGRHCPSIPLWGETDSSTSGHSAYLQTQQQPTLAARIFLDALLQREPRIVRSVEY